MAQSSEPKRVFINNIDASNFPSIELNIRAFAAGNEQLTNLSAADINVLENGTQAVDVTVTQGAAVPSIVYFIIDRNSAAKFGNNTDIIRSELEKFAIGGHFRAGIDTVAVLATDATQLNDVNELLPPTQNPEAFRAVVSQLNLTPQNDGDSIEGVRYAYNQIIQLAEPSQANFAIIHIGTLFTGDRMSVLKEEALGLATDFQSAGIRFYGVHALFDFGTGTTTADSVDIVRSLTDNTGGQYIVYGRDSDNSAGFRGLYENLTSHAISYDISYTSRSGDSGIRSVNVVPAGTVSSEETQVITYEQILVPPRLEILEPVETGATFTRIGNQTETGSQSKFEYDRDKVDVEVALLDWEDGIPRDIRSVEFLVNGESIASGSNNDNTYKFAIDLTNLTEEGSFVIPFSVRMLDEFGLEGEVESLINVTVENKEAVRPTPTPGPTPTPVVVVTVLPTLTANFPEPPCLENPRTLECGFSLLPWLLAAISSISLVFVSIRYRQQLQDVGQAVGNVTKQVRATILGGARHSNKVIAQMEVKRAREDLVGKTIDIYTSTTTFGRDPREADVQLYDEEGKSSVSGSHCTLTYESGSDSFLLTDHSSAGTKVNGQRIASDDPTELSDGDEIMLGDEFRRGALLTFKKLLPHKPATTGTVPNQLSQQEEDTSSIFGDSGEISRDREGVFEYPGEDDEPLSGNEMILDQFDESGYDVDNRRAEADDDDDDWLSELE